jgi:hypothetical protein
VKASAALLLRVVGYGAVLAAGALALHGSTTSASLACTPATSSCSWSRPLSSGWASGWACGVFAAPAAAPFDGNPRAQASIGLSERELEVLHELRRRPLQQGDRRAPPRVAQHDQDARGPRVRKSWAHGGVPTRSGGHASWAWCPEAAFFGVNRPESPFRVIAQRRRSPSMTGSNHPGE